MDKGVEEGREEVDVEGIREPGKEEEGGRVAEDEAEKKGSLPLGDFYYDIFRNNYKGEDEEGATN